jgi:hypothetical protein
MYVVTKASAAVIRKAYVGTLVRVAAAAPG